MFEKPTVSACRGLLLTKAPRFLLNAESSLLPPQDCRAPPSATRTTVPAPRGERRGDPQSGSITAASADQRAPKSSVRWARGRTLVSPSRPGRCRPRPGPLCPAAALQSCLCGPRPPQDPMTSASVTSPAGPSTDCRALWRPKVEELVYEPRPTEAGLSSTHGLSSLPAPRWSRAEKV